MEEVGARVVLAQALAAARLDADRHLVFLAGAALRHLDAVDDELGAAVVGVEDLAPALAADDGARVADLAPGLGVAPACGRGSPRRLALSRRTRRASACPRRWPGCAPGAVSAVVAEEAAARRMSRRVAGRPAAVGRLPRRQSVALARARSRWPPSLPRSRRGSPSARDQPASWKTSCARSVGEAVRIVEREQEAAVRDLAARRPCAAASRYSGSWPCRGRASRRSAPPRADGLGHARVLLPDLGVRLAQPVDHRGRHVPQEGLDEAQHAPVAHRPAHDPAQHVAAPLVRGRHAVGDEEGGRARVVGDHAHRHVLLLVRAVGLAGESRSTCATSGANRSVS